MTSNATPIEVAWTLTNIAGLLIAIVNAIWAQQRLLELRRTRQNGVLKVLRTGARNDQIALALAFAAMMLIGVVAMATPQNPNVTQAGLLSGSCFILVDGALLWISITVRFRPIMLRSAMQSNDSEGELNL